MTPTDVALLDEAHWLIDPEFRRFGHVVVDEAQNLTPMELRMTVRRARGQSLTILGDLSQRTADAGRVARGSAVLREAGVGAHAVSELRVSYRVPERVPRARGRAAARGRAGAARACARRRSRRSRSRADDLGAAAARVARAAGGRRRQRRARRAARVHRGDLRPRSRRPSTPRAARR